MATSRTSNSSYVPAGYCPRCGHAMDPGTCPECGTTVAAGELDSNSSRLQRRWIRRGIVVSVLLALALGGRYAYHSLDWPSLLPTGILLPIQGGEHAPATVELARRAINGNLTPEQVDRLFHQAIGLEDALHIRSPHPAGKPIMVQVTADYENPYDGPVQLKVFAGIKSGSFGIGESPAGFDALVWQYGGSGSGGVSVSNRAELPPLTAGEHLITINGTIEFLSHVPGLSPSPYEFTVSRRIVVEDRPLAAYVQPVWDAEVAAEMTMSLRLVTIGTPHIMWQLETQRAGMTVAGSLWWRPAGVGEFRETPGRLYTMGHGLGMWSGHFTLHEEDSAWEAGDSMSIDVRLVPDPKTAFDHGAETYFSGVIEWSNVPVQEMMNLLSAEPLPPTGIYASEETP